MHRPVALILTCWLLTAAAAAQPDHGLLADLQRQLASGDHVAALATARLAVGVHGDLAGLWYNLAGLEVQHGDLERAVAAFERAVLLGFDDFRHADQDRDLGHLPDQPRYQQLRAAWADGLAAARNRRGLHLMSGRWSDLTALPDGRGGAAADLRLRVDADFLQLELRLDAGSLPPSPPWHPGGGGVLVSLVLPEDATTGDGRQTVEVGFGWLDGLPAGAIRLGSRWQRLAELGPKMRLNHDDGRLELSASIPWTACGSLHPLVDPDLALNVTYVKQQADDRGAAFLIDDPGLGRPDRPWRRGVPLRIDWQVTRPVVQARLAATVVRDGRASLLVRGLLPAGRGPAAAHVVLHDRDGRVVHDSTVPLVASGAVPEARVDLDLASHVGSGRLGVSLGAGRALGLSTWETTFATIPAGWEDGVAARIAAAPVAEQPSLQYRRDAVAAALASRLPRDDASALATTLDELEVMLDRVAERGTALPAGGGFLAVMPAAQGDPPLACSLALPPGWQHGQAGPVLLLLARAPGAEHRAVSLAHRLLAEKSPEAGSVPLVLAVPHLPADHDPDLARRRTARLLAWLREFLGCGEIHLAAVDLLGATALELAAEAEGNLAAVLIITGVHFEPYPEDADEALAARVVGVPAELPIGWIWFPEEILAGDQSAPLRDALQAGGRRLSPATRVAGGLGFDQAWSRAVLWAAGLDPAVARPSACRRRRPPSRLDENQNRFCVTSPACRVSEAALTRQSACRRTDDDHDPGIYLDRRRPARHLGGQAPGSHREPAGLHREGSRRRQGPRRRPAGRRQPARVGDQQRRRSAVAAA